MTKNGWGFWFTASKDNHTWRLAVQPRGRSFEEFTRRNGRITQSTTVSFQYGQEAKTKYVFDKFVERAKKAEAEPFEKAIIQLQGTFSGDLLNPPRTFTFCWRKGALDSTFEGEAYLMESDSIGICFKHDIVCFAEMMKFLPDMRNELVEKIQKGESEKELFKQPARPSRYSLVGSRLPRK